LHKKLILANIEYMQIHVCSFSAKIARLDFRDGQGENSRIVSGDFLEIIEDSHVEFVTTW